MDCSDQAGAGMMSRAQRLALVARLVEAGETDAAREIAGLQRVLDKLIPVVMAAVDLVCAPGWSCSRDEEADLEAALRRHGWVHAVESAPVLGAATGDSGEAPDSGV